PDDLWRVARADDSIIPEPCCRKITIGFRFDLGLKSLPRRDQLGFIDRFALLGGSVALDYIHNARELLRSHHCNPMIGPGEQKTRLVCAAAHRIVAGSIGSADHNDDGRHRGVWLT